jgi:UDP-glucose 4-epimerase
VTAYQGKNIIVTGGAGFIGSHLCDALLKSGANRVAVVDNFFLGKEKNLASAQRDYGEQLHVYREDAGEFAAMRAVCDIEKPDMVFNFATKALLYSFFNPAGSYRVNTNIALNLLEILRAGSMGRLIHISTSEVFGSAQYVPMDEAHPLLAETTYAAGKAAADIAVESYVRMFALDAFIVRPFNNYGPRQNDQSLAAIIPLTLRRIREGLPPILQGTGEQTRDFIYVEDTISALLKISTLDGLAGQNFNLGSGRETSIKEILDTLCSAVNYDASYELQPARVADVLRHCASVDKITSLIGEVAPTSLVDGMRKTVKWYTNKP